MIFLQEDIKEGVISPLIGEPSFNLVDKLSAKGVIKFLKEIRCVEYRYRENIQYTAYLNYSLRAEERERNTKILKEVFANPFDNIGIYLARRILGYFDRQRERTFDTDNFNLNLSNINQIINNYPMGQFVNDVFDNQYQVDLLNGHLTDVVSSNNTSHFVRRRRGFVGSHGQVNEIINTENTVENTVEDLSFLDFSEEPTVEEETEEPIKYQFSITKNDKELSYQTDDLDVFKAFFGAFIFNSPQDTFSLKIKSSDENFKNQLNTIFSNDEEVVYDTASGELKLVSSNTDLENGIVCTASQLEKIKNL